MIVTEGELQQRRKTGGVDVKALPVSMFSRSRDLFFKNNTPVSGQDEGFERIVPVLAFVSSAPKLSNDRQWLALEHQCGGLVCMQVAMIATVLTPNGSIKEKLDDIGRQFYAAQHGRLAPGDVRASSLSAYLAAIGKIGLICEYNRPRLAEGLYPIDCTQENLDKIASDALRLRTLIESSYIRARDSSDPVILLLANNSD